MKYCTLILVVMLVVSCTRFHPQPLSPAQTAAQLESRSLTNLTLKVFIEKNTHRSLTSWPAIDWDLDLLTLAAFYYHPSLEVARADWRVAQGATKTAAERPNPTVTASGTYEPAAGAFSPWIPGLIFDLPIETVGKRRLRTDQARHLSAAAQFNVAGTAWQVRSRVRAGLLEFVAARQRLELLQRELELRANIAERLDRQFRAGAISANELNVARLALLRTSADLADARRLVAEARPHLATAIGLSATALDDVNVRFDLSMTGTAEALTTNEVRRLALLGRADILAALADYAASQSDLQLQVARQYPDIRLSTGYSWNAGSTGEHDWQLGVNVELPLLNQHQGAIAEATARREASAARFLALQAKVIGEIEAAVASFRAGQTNFAALEALVASQSEQVRRIQSQFQAGAADQLDLLAAELELSTVNVLRLDSQVKLQQALGGLEDAVQRPFAVPETIFESTGTDAFK